MSVTLRPSVGVMLASEDIAKTTLNRALARHLVTLGDFVGDDALRVVRRSLMLADNVHITSVLFDLERKVFVCIVSLPMELGEARAALKTNYTTRAADTWMESDIRIVKAPVTCELHLSLVSAKPMSCAP